MCDTAAAGRHNDRALTMATSTGSGRDRRRDALDLLQWYDAMGADEAIGNDALDRFAQSARLASRRRQPRNAEAPARPALPAAGTVRRPAAVAPPGEETARQAATTARACDSLDELRSALEKLEGCPLKNTASNLVFEDGNRQARLMLVGEAPGRDEDIQGKPFVGRSGQLLDRMLAAIGIDRDAAYIANVIYWRPPGNRTPTTAETAICRPFIERQIELVDPAVLVFLGGVAAKEMLNTTTGIMRLRGSWRHYPVPDGPYRAIATLHPAYLLRQPAQKGLAWQDFRKIRQALDEIADGGG